AVQDGPLVLPGAGYLTFSSGTQGTPKGIIGNAAGVAHFLDWEAALLGLGPADLRVAQLTSPSFDVVLREMLLPLVVGGVLCVAGAGIRSDPSAVLPWLADERVSAVHLVPSLSSRWLAASGRARLPDLRWTLFAGEPLHSRHVETWRAVAPKTRVVNLYGPSETTLATFWHLVAESPEPGLQPVGRGLPGVRLTDGPPDPRDGAAEGTFRLTIETPDGALGYLPDTPEDAGAQGLTRRDGVTTFRTQDRGRLDERGRLYVEGRLDGTVKRLGVLVDLSRIAADALDDPDVRQACCVQVDVETSGDVVLAVEAGAAFSVPDFTRRLRRRLGTAMPNTVMIFDPLPLLPNGKVDRRRVLAAAESRRRAAPDTAVPREEVQ
ncbi:AMP-binding protein, partial [Streptomyces sp. NPDC003247]|uniref:AMP-binding protein n=1 Tax=Streptomyces sp. NPDC003247 TaxID=3364677 RepID=UPI00367C838D